MDTENLNNLLNCGNCASDGVFVNNNKHLECNFCGSILELNVKVRNNKHIDKRITNEVQELQLEFSKRATQSNDMYIGEVYDQLFDFLQNITNQQIIDHVEKRHELGTAKTQPINIPNYFNEPK